MNFYLFNAVLGVIVSNFAYESRAKSAVDRALFEEMDYYELDDPIFIGNVNPRDEFPIEGSTMGRGHSEQCNIVKDPMETVDSFVLGERANGRFCGKLIGQHIGAEVQAFSDEHLYISDLYWDTSLKTLTTLHIKISYMDFEETSFYIIEPNPKLYKRLQFNKFYLKYGGSKGKVLKLMEVFNSNNKKDILASLDLSTCRPPSKVFLNQLTGTSHGVSSGNITLLSADAIRIDNFVQPLEENDLVFWAGYGKVHRKTGYVVPIQERAGRLRRYNQEEITIELPFGKTFYDVDYFAVLSRLNIKSFGHVCMNRIDWQSDLLPPPWFDDLFL